MNRRHPGRPKRADWDRCKYAECENTTEGGAKGFCPTHYMALRRGRITENGELLRPMMRVSSYGPGARCLVPGCGCRPCSRDLCSRHYQQWEDGIDLGVVIPDRAHTKITVSYGTTKCLVAGCDLRPVNRWMCNKHAAQREAGIIDKDGNKLRDVFPSGRKRERERWVGSTRDGYILRAAPKGHPYSRADGTILEHRLVMEQIVGRYLEEWEIVHHKDGNRANNHPRNLELLDGRARKGISHPPGHNFDESAAVQILLQSESVPAGVKKQLEKWKKQA